MRSGIWFCLAMSCGGATPGAPPIPQPGGHDQPTPAPYVPPDLQPVTAPPQTVLGHAQECAQVLGPIPGFDCLTDADPVPVTRDGVPQTTQNPSTCDRPSLLEGSCNIWTRAGAKQGTWSDGSPRPEVTFVFTCRSSDDQAPTDEGGEYHDVAMIGHNRDTGATCFFQSFPDGRVRYFPSPMTAGSGAPDYGEVDALQVWDPPAETASIECHRCHNADPWIHSPWIDQMPSRALPEEPMVPWTELGSAYHVAGTEFAYWAEELAYFDIPGNPCLSCHRIGVAGCDEFVAYSAGDPTWLPLDGDTYGQVWMPPDFAGTQDDWERVWRPAVTEIRACCDAPGLPGCNVTATPAGQVYVP
ncbi:MAG: hypothetical protein KC656_05775 [Myxococcales bacterium]|nr:hypothetical protein [Myxococcales bacterium]